MKVTSFEPPFEDWETQIFVKGCCASDAGDGGYILDFVD